MIFVINKIYKSQKLYIIMWQTIMKSLTDKIYKIMKSKSINEAFIYNDFLNIGKYDAIRKSFSRLEKAKKIVKILPGIYYVPYFSKLIKEYTPPPIDGTINALQRKFGWTLISDNNMFLNKMNLDTQIPVKFSFYTDGPSKKYAIAGVEIKLKHKIDHDLKKVSPKYGNIVRAVKVIGKDRMTNDQKEVLKKLLNEKEKDELINESKKLPEWIRNQIQTIYKK